MLFRSRASISRPNLNLLIQVPKLGIYVSLKKKGNIFCSNIFSALIPSTNKHTSFYFIFLLANLDSWDICFIRILVLKKKKREEKYPSRCFLSPPIFFICRCSLVLLIQWLPLKPMGRKKISSRESPACSGFSHGAYLSPPIPDISSPSRTAWSFIRWPSLYHLPALFVLLPPRTRLSLLQLPARRVSSPACSPSGHGALRRSSFSLPRAARPILPARAVVEAFGCARPADLAVSRARIFFAWS